MLSATVMLLALNVGLDDERRRLQARLDELRRALAAAERAADAAAPNVTHCGGHIRKECLADRFAEGC
jgi:hypothetical protein